jgi:hypothetical protein
VRIHPGASVLIALALTAFADEAPAVRVTVLDPTGTAIGGAKVQLTRGEERQALETDTSGQAIFSGITPAGLYHLEVQADGFEPWHLEYRVGGKTPSGLTARLTLARRAEQLEVRAEPRWDSFTTILTADQIDELPDDPEEMEAVLRQIAGPDAIIQVDGFRGGKLPHKSEIREIRFRLNPYAAGNHEPSLVTIEVLTKPGTTGWRSTARLGWNDAWMNARPAFSASRGNAHQRRLGFTLDGPISKGRTSLWVSAIARNAEDSKGVVALLPNGPSAELVSPTAEYYEITGRVEHSFGAPRR